MGPPPSSMSYVASCSFSSSSDCNITNKTNNNYNDTLFSVNIETNSSSISSSSNNNKSNSNSKNKKKPKGRFPSSFRQLRPMMFKKNTNGEKKTDVMNSVVVPISKIA